MRAAQSKLFLYRERASIDCMLFDINHLFLKLSSVCSGDSSMTYRVFTVSSGIVVYTVITPAVPPIRNVLIAPSFSPGATYACAICRSVV